VTSVANGRKIATLHNGREIGSRVISHNGSALIGNDAGSLIGLDGAPSWPLAAARLAAARFHTRR